MSKSAKRFEVPIRITDDELIAEVRNVRRAKHDVSSSVLEYVAAMFIVSRFLGNEWVQRAVNPKVADPFIGSLASAGIDQQTHMARLKELSETMFNLQDVEGFLDDRLTSLRRDRKGAEASCFELYTGRILHRAGLRVEFLRTTGLKKCHELNFYIGGETYPVEVKLKHESTACSEASILKSLKEAREQLPKNGKGIVFLAIPETWTALSLNSEIIRPAVREVMRRSSRIAAVVVVWRDTHVNEWGGGSLVTLAVDRNPNVPMAEDVAGLLNNLVINPKVPWTTLGDIVDRS